MSKFRFSTAVHAALTVSALAACGASGDPGNAPSERVASSEEALSGPANIQTPVLNGASPPPPTGPLTEHGGPVMTSASNKLYYVWYGNWSGNTGAKTILTDYANAVGGTPWYDIATRDYDGTGNSVPSAIANGGSYTDSAASQGTSLPNAAAVATVVNHAITASGTHLPNDPNGIYVVFAGSNITTQASCGFCGYHNFTTVAGSTIKFALVPDPSVVCGGSPGCIPHALYGYPSPNNNPSADAMVNTLSHEMMETLTDPVGTGWLDASGNENGDECNFNFGTMYAASSCSGSVCANERIGSRDYLMQQIPLVLGSSTQFCSQRYLRNNDIVWRNNTTGDVVTQRGDGASTPTFVLTSTVPTQWSIVGHGDFDGDGFDDWLWRNTTTGDVSEWLMNGTAVVSGTTIAAALPLAWKTVGIGDFNGDGKMDVLWRNTSTGDVVVWFMSGTTVTSSVTVFSALPLAWTTNGTGDYNDDGKSDILWRNTSTGDVFMWLMNGSVASSSGTVAAALPAVWQVIGQAGDFDGDGKSDILFQNTSTKDVVVWLMSGLTIKASGTAKAAFTGFELIGVGDFDGNGKADIEWRSTSTENLQTWRMNGTAIAATFTPLTGSNPALVSNGTYGDQNR
jgi:hypothetical protein